MRCYLTTDGLFVRTQAEAGKDWQRVELPDDQASRIALYNALTGKAEQGLWWWLVEAIRQPAGVPTVEAGAAAEASIQITGGSLPQITSDDPNIWRRVTTIPWPPEGKTVAIAPNTTPIVQPSLTDVEAFIQSADAYQLRSLFENVVLRGRELIGEARP
nr:hypothetical protein [Sphingomonas sp. Y57]